MVQKNGFRKEVDFDIILITSLNVHLYVRLLSLFLDAILDIENVAIKHDDVICMVYVYLCAVNFFLNYRL